MSVPELRNIHKRFSNDDSFVLIGISSDHDEAVWRAFTDENKMVWPQYLDKDRRILQAFNIRAFPTYVIIDHEGIRRFQRTGMQMPGILEDAIKRQVKAAAQSVQAR